MTIFTILWFLNGLAQGPGWPAAALIMKAVSTQEEDRMYNNVFDDNYGIHANFLINFFMKLGDYIFNIVLNILPSSRACGLLLSL